VFDFVMNRERVDFPEALRMLADRAGIALDSPTATAEPRGPSKRELFEVNNWAREVFAKALRESPVVLDYLASRGLSRQSIERFHLGYAPLERGWLLQQARRRSLGLAILEQAGLASPPPEGLGNWRERFRGRLIFPIHDDLGRTIGFGGRVLPDVEKRVAAEGRRVAKYLNSPETVLFHKRTILYGAELARPASRQAGWVAVVEGYTDVIAAHEVGLANVVGTLGTALGEDHLQALRRMTDRVVLVFDADEAGQSAADRALELFLRSDLELRVLTLPEGLDPCEFLLERGADAFRQLADQAIDPLAHLLARAADRFDLDSAEGSRRGAEWVLSTMSHIPSTRVQHLGLEVKEAKVLDTLSHRLHVPLETLTRLRNQLRRSAARERVGRAAAGEKTTSWAGRGQSPAEVAGGPVAPIRQSDLDRTDLELIEVVLSEPSTVNWLIPRLAVSSIRDLPLQTILQGCYDLQNEGVSPSYENLMVRLEDPAIRALAASLVGQSALRTPDPGQFPEDLRPAPWQERLEQMLNVLDRRERQTRLSELKRSLDETDRNAEPEAYRAIQLEYQRLLTSGRTRRS
jgi:DNA primase